MSRTTRVPAALPLCASIAIAGAACRRVVPVSQLEAKPALVVQAHRDCTAATFSPDGKTLATANSDGSVALWLAATGELSRTLPHCGSHVRRLEFSRDGALIVAGCEDGSVTAWDARSGEVRCRVPGDGRGFWAMACSPSAARIAVSLHEHPRRERGLVRLFDAATGALVTELPVQRRVAVGLAFSPDESKLMLAVGGRLVAWSLADGAASWEQPCRFDVRRIAFSADGSRLLLSGIGAIPAPSVHTGRLERDRFEVREAATGAMVCERTTNGILGTNANASFWPDAESVGLGEQIWSATDGSLREALEVTALAHSPDGVTTFARDVRNQYGAWDRTKRAFRWMLPPDAASVDAVAVSPDGSLLAAGSNDGAVVLWNLRSGDRVRDLAGHRRWITSLAFSPDGEGLAVVAAESDVEIWNPRSGERRREWPDDFRGSGAVAFSPDGRWLAVARVTPPGFDASEIVLFDAKTAESKGIWATGPLGIRSLAFSPDSQTLAIGRAHGATHPGEIELWDVARGACVGTLSTNSCTINARMHGLAFSPDGKLLAGACEPYDDGRRFGELTLWRTATGERVRTLRSDGIPATSIAYSPDGRCLAAGSRILYAPGDATIWDASSGARLRTLPVAANVVAFSPDGRRLAGASGCAGVTLVDARTNEVLVTLRTLPDERAPTGREWIAYTPAGDYAGSPGVAEFIRWRDGDTLVPGERLETLHHRPDLVRRRLERR
jgi:WD40 repeat protein